MDIIYVNHAHYLGTHCTLLR